MMVRCKQQVTIASAGSLTAYNRVGMRLKRNRSLRDGVFSVRKSLLGLKKLTNFEWRQTENELKLEGNRPNHSKILINAVTHNALWDLLATLKTIQIVLESVWLELALLSSNQLTTYIALYIGRKIWFDSVHVEWQMLTYAWLGLQFVKPC